MKKLLVEIRRLLPDGSGKEEILYGEITGVTLKSHGRLVGIPGDENYDIVDPAFSEVFNGLPLENIEDVKFLDVLPDLSK
jgi:hypothetical protein